MSSFILKIIAIISMSFDHFGYFFGNIHFSHLIGRLAFPIFSYQLSIGVSHTKNIFKYALRLFVFAVISQIPFMLFEYTFSLPFSLNVFFTLLLGLCTIYSFDKMPNKYLKIIVPIFCIILGDVINVDYGSLGILLIFLFYLCKDNKLNICFSLIAFCLTEYIPLYISSNFNSYVIYLILSTLAAIIPIILYNNKRGPKMKYFFYIFYPAHLTLIYFFNTFIF